MKDENTELKNGYMQSKTNTVDNIIKCIATNVPDLYARNMNVSAEQSKHDQGQDANALLLVTQLVIEYNKMLPSLPHAEGAGMDATQSTTDAPNEDNKHQLYVRLMIERSSGLTNTCRSNRYRRKEFENWS